MVVGEDFSTLSNFLVDVKDMNIDTEMSHTEWNHSSEVEQLEKFEEY